MTASTARALTTQDLEVFHSIRPSLTRWLRETHGRGDWQAGWLGLSSATVSLVGMYSFGLSPLLAVLHVLVTLITEGIGPRIAAGGVRNGRERSGRLFLSPGHALTFARAVIAAMRGTGPLGRQGLIAFSVIPSAPVPAESSPSQQKASALLAPRWARTIAPLVWSVLGLAMILVAFLVVLMISPIVQAASTLFDAYDVLGLAILLVINLAQVGSVWRDLHTPAPDAPWQVAWFLDPPALSDLIFWHQLKTFPLIIATVVAFILAISPGPLLNHYRNDPTGFAVALDTHLLGVTTGLFVLLGLLHALLLAAPWHARRLITALDAIEPSQPSLQANQEQRRNTSRYR